MSTRIGRIGGRVGRVDGSTMGAVAAGLWVQGALLFTGILGARILGVEDRGHLALLWLIPLSVAALLNLGLPLAATFFIARDTRRARPIVRSLAPIGALQVVGVTAVQALALLIYLSGQSHHIVTSGLVSLPWAASVVVQLYALALFQGQSRFVAFNVARAAPMTIYATAVIVLFLTGGGSLFSLTLAVVASNVLTGVVALAVGLTSLPPTTADAEVPPRREMFVFGGKALFGSFSMVETLQVDQTFVGIALTPAALGLYVVASSFTNVVRFTVANLGMIAYPQVASAKDPAAARARIWRYFNGTVVVCLGVALILELLVGWLLPFVFGAAFKGAVPLARILIPGGVLLCGRRMLSDGVRGADFPGLGTVAEVASWAWLVPALFVFVHLWGARGAAWAATTSYAFSLAVLLVLVFRREEIRPAWFSSLVERRGLRARRRGGGPDLPLPESLGPELVPEVLELERGSTALGEAEPKD
jgi:O-antigen/teichoic acid export membrane protein